MTDDDLRALVRDAIARHLGGAAASSQDAASAPRPEPAWRAHASFGKFLNLPGDADAGACLIEPGVACNHCGFCKSYGH
jgi:hypothetical protein